MLRVGLTGGIGSGKSSVVVMLREMGVPVIEADDLAHELSRAGEAVHDEIVQTFGREILAENGEIDRARLAGVVFGSPEKLERLNRIVHPRVLERTERWIGERRREGAALVVVDGGGREHLIPFRAPIVTRLDRAARRIEVDLPPGLLEL